MGVLYEASCRCGFQCRNLPVGGGMFTGGAYGVPVACPDCHALWSEDEKSDCRKCRQCGADVYRLHESGNFKPRRASDRLHPRYPWFPAPERHDAPARARGPDLQSPIPSPFIDRVPDVRYRCPGCGKMTMRFIEAGCWD